MKLKQFLDNLNDLIKRNPEALEFEVISAIDEEGNGYNKIYYAPSMGHFDNGEFTNSDNPTYANSICIN